jgi:hypothetical protein
LNPVAYAVGVEVIVRVEIRHHKIQMGWIKKRLIEVRDGHNTRKLRTGSSDRQDMEVAVSY